VANIKKKTCIYVDVSIEIFVAFEIMAASLICVSLCKKKIFFNAKLTFHVYS